MDSFWTSRSAAPPINDIVDAFTADPTLRLVPALPDQADGTAAPTVTTRKALKVHPRIAAMFITARAIPSAVEMVRSLRAIAPNQLRVLEDFIRCAATEGLAGHSALRAPWQRIPSDSSDELSTWFIELVDSCAPRPAAGAAHQPPPPPAPAGLGGAASLSEPLDPQGFAAAIQRIAENSDRSAAAKSTDYKPHELTTLFAVCNVPFDEDRERGPADLAGIWRDLPKHRDKEANARDYVERRLRDYWPAGKPMNVMIITPAVVQDIMKIRLNGPDMTDSWAWSHRGISNLTLGPLDHDRDDPVAEREMFARFEQVSTRLNPDQLKQLDNASAKVARELIAWPYDRFTFMRAIDHVEGAITVIMGPRYNPLQFYQRLGRALLRTPTWAAWRKEHYWTAWWTLHIAHRQFHAEGSLAIFARLLEDVEGRRLPDPSSMPAQARSLCQRPAVVSDSSSGGSVASDLSSLSGSTGSDSSNGSGRKKATVPEPPSKKQRKLKGLAADLTAEVAYAVDSLGPDKRKSRPSAFITDPNELLGVDFLSIVDKTDGEEPCLLHHLYDTCTNKSCPRSHKLTRKYTAGMVDGIKQRFRAAVDAKKGK